MAHVTVFCEYSPCDCGVCPGSLNDDSYSYIETFGVVRKGETVGTGEHDTHKYMDVAQFTAQLPSCVKYEQFAEFRLYCRNKDWDPGTLPDNTFVFGDQLKKDIDAGGNQKRWSEKRTHGMTSYCDSTIGNPSLPSDDIPDWWKNNEGIATAQFRTLKVNYDCCPKSPKQSYSGKLANSSS